MIRIKTIILVGAAMAIAACSGYSDEEKANKLLDEATQQMEKGEYAQALVTIDSLRKTFPNNVEARKKALTIYQQSSLKQAQADLAHTDSLLSIVSDEYNKLKAKVDGDRTEMKATYEDTQRLNTTKARLDSLKVRFDMECAKIKYIHKKQKE